MIDGATRLTVIQQADPQVAVLIGVVRSQLAEALNGARGSGKITFAQVNGFEVGQHADEQMAERQRLESVFSRCKRTAGKFFHEPLTLFGREPAPAVKRVKQNFLAV